MFYGIINKYKKCVCVDASNGTTMRLLLRRTRQVPVCVAAGVVWMDNWLVGTWLIG